MNYNSWLLRKPFEHFLPIFIMLILFYFLLLWNHEEFMIRRLSKNLFFSIISCSFLWAVLRRWLLYLPRFLVLYYELVREFVHWLLLQIFSSLVSLTSKILPLLRLVVYICHWELNSRSGLALHQIPQHYAFLRLWMLWSIYRNVLLFTMYTCKVCRSLFQRGKFFDYTFELILIPSWLLLIKYVLQNISTLFRKAFKFILLLIYDLSSIVALLNFLWNLFDQIFVLKPCFFIHHISGVLFCKFRVSFPT